MLFERIESPGLTQYSYLLGEGTQAIVIDPRRDCNIYLDLAQDAGKDIITILETHRHEDFVSGSVELAARSGAPVWHVASHVPGALAMELSRLPQMAGWFLTYDTPLLLIVEDDPRPALATLRHQGFDAIQGYLGGGMSA